MDICDALSLWTELGYSRVTWTTDQAYYILFIKDGEVVGNIKTVAGYITWDFPEELMVEHNARKA